MNVTVLFITVGTVVAKDGTRIFTTAARIPVAVLTLSRACAEPAKEKDSGAAPMTNPNGRPADHNQARSGVEGHAGLASTVQSRRPLEIGTSGDNEADQLRRTIMVNRSKRAAGVNSGVMRLGDSKRRKSLPAGVEPGLLATLKVNQ